MILQFQPLNPKVPKGGFNTGFDTGKLLLPYLGRCSVEQQHTHLGVVAQVAVESKA